MAMVDVEPVTIAPLVSGDAADWRRLRGGYQRPYGVAQPDTVHVSTWARLLNPGEPVSGAIALRCGTAISLVHHILHPICWDTADSCYLQHLYVN